MRDVGQGGKTTVNATYLIMLIAGGIVGTLARYKVMELSMLCSSLKMDVLLVNVLGSFTIGFFYALSQRYNLDARYTLFIATGFCGAFTTMSSFVLENHDPLAGQSLSFGLRHNTFECYSFVECGSALYSSYIFRTA